MNIIFVKHGRKYHQDDVNRLFESLYQYRPDFKYFCYTEEEEFRFSTIDRRINIIKIPHKPFLKKWWNKLALFSEKFPLHGKTIYFDLDTQINEDPFEFIDDIDWSALTLINCHWKSDKIYDRSTNYDVRINSSIMAWDADNPKLYKLWDHFINSGLKDYFLRKYKGIDRYIVHEGFEYKTLDPKYINSYKFEKEKKAPITTFEEIDYEEFIGVISKS